MEVNGRRVVVMGGGSGIGEATAALFAARGAEVTITGRTLGKLEAAASRMTGKVTAKVVDACSRAALEEFFTAHGPVDHLVISVSSSLGAGEFATLDLEMLHQAFEAKFWAHLQAAQVALPHLTEKASILFVTAASARAALPGTAGLAAVNGALEKVVPPLATELAPIRVNAVSPGLVDTPWWDALPSEAKTELFDGIAKILPVGYVAQPEEIAQAIYLVAANPYITGTVLEVDGGAHLATGR
jgi:NAD(P)-dependent dehydrogenase (short-subunit alcohol dehydrogenase family)